MGLLADDFWKMLPYSEVLVASGHTFMRQSTEPYLPYFTHLLREVPLFLRLPRTWQSLLGGCLARGVQEKLNPLGDPIGYVRQFWF